VSLRTLFAVSLIGSVLPLGTIGVSVAARSASAAPDAPAPRTAWCGVREVRFEAVDVFIDARAPISAYQFELDVSQGHAEIVGVEGGEHPAFAEPPYSDPAALRNDRIIIAAYDLGPDLPAGRVRVARVHLLVHAAASYEARLDVALGRDADDVDATIEWKGSVQ